MRDGQVQGDEAMTFYLGVFVAALVWLALCGEHGIVIRWLFEPRDDEFPGGEQDPHDQAYYEEWNEE